jgi:hypothetical protein
MYAFAMTRSIFFSSLFSKWTPFSALGLGIERGFLFVKARDAPAAHSAAFEEQADGLTTDVAQALGHLGCGERFEVVAQQVRVKVLDPEVGFRLIFIRPWAAHEHLFAGQGLLHVCREFFKQDP